MLTFDDVKDRMETEEQLRWLKTHMFPDDDESFYGNFTSLRSYVRAEIESTMSDYFYLIDANVDEENQDVARNEVIVGMEVFEALLKPNTYDFRRL